MPLKIPVFCFFFLCVFSAFSQRDSLRPQKIYFTERISNPPKIDGILDEEMWQTLPAAENFVMIEPGDGTPIPETHATKVKIAYTDEAIYIGAWMRDSEPQKIRREIAQRDNIPVADFFLIDINTYNDGENQTRFLVTAAGTLADAKMTGDREDYSYNVVYDAAVSLNDEGWYAEMKIPYSALRFPESEKQVWSIQMARNIRHLNQTYVWNYIDKSVGKATHYNGLLKGIENVDAPLRLSFYPYVSGGIDLYEGETEESFSAGMDLKLGISEAFTLDATLIPDFGQTAYDEVELNLGPFEQTFGENRAFFTEGIELFSKGGLFYSRRIGDTPTGFNRVQELRLADQEIIENPEETDLLNALKISGRTDSGLGIGFFNAVTGREFAVLKDRTTGEITEIMTEPFANYNIFVLDQQFDQKSSISLINTNVTRDGHFRDGNVTGFLFDVYNPTSSFNFSGEAKMSNVNLPQQNISGFASTLQFERTKGKFRYGITHDFANETYDINDLGLNFRNNYSNFFLNTSYRIFEPQGIFNSYNIRLYGNHRRRYEPNVLVGNGAGTSFFGMTRERLALGGFLEVNSKNKDFFEPRRAGSYILYPGNIVADAWISTDYRKKFAVDSGITYGNSFGSDREDFYFRFSPRFRVSDRFLLVYEFNYDKENARRSFVELLPENVIFGTRSMKSLENSLRGSYNFSTRDAVSLSFRNFWSVANFDDNQFYFLQENGTLAASDYRENSENDPDANFNIWNLDLSYQWRFAPGSEIILLYRNSVFNLDDQSKLIFTESLENLFEQPARHNLSLKIVYYLDYSTIKNVMKG